MKKICFFPGTLELGGIGKLFINLMEEYATRSDISVDIFLTKKQGEFVAKIPDNVRIIEGNGRALNSIFALVKYINREKPDAVISAREYLNMFNIACCSLASFPTKAVVSFHTVQTVENFYRAKSANKKNLYSTGYYKVISRLLYKIPPKIVAVSQGVADDVIYRMGVDRRKVEVIYNPAYKPYIEEETIAAPAFEEFTKGNRRFIVALGRLNEYKGFDMLLDAFKLVRQRMDVGLVILGDGPIRSELEAQADALALSKDVLFMGFVHNPLYYVKRSALHVVSSKYEGFGNTIVEAMGVGVPVVSTDCPSGPAEILENGKYGKLVPVGNSELMADAIIESLHEEHDPEILIKRAQDFAISKIADHYLSYIYAEA